MNTHELSNLSINQSDNPTTRLCYISLPAKINQVIMKPVVVQNPKNIGDQCT